MSPDQKTCKPEWRNKLAVMPKNEATSESLEGIPSHKKKRRNVGEFPCSKCSKIFSRSDHLARHHLNHQPKQVYVCEFYIKNHSGAQRSCGKTFVRRDLRDRHYRRHLLEVPDEGVSTGNSENVKNSLNPSLDPSAIAEDRNDHPLGPSTSSITQHGDGQEAALTQDRTQDFSEAHPHVRESTLRHDSFSQSSIQSKQSPDENISSISEGTKVIPATTSPSFGQKESNIMERHQSDQLLRSTSEISAIQTQNLGLQPLLAPPQQLNPLQVQIAPYQHNLQPYPQHSFQLHSQHSFQPHSQQQSLQRISSHLSSDKSIGQYNPGPQHVRQSSGLPIQRTSEEIHGRPHTGQITPTFQREVDLVKPEDIYPNRHAFVQSQNDILSWLFMESPQEVEESGLGSKSTSMQSQIPRYVQSANHYESHPLLNNFQHSESRLHLSNGLENPYTWPPQFIPTTEAPADSMLNVGLQDLNYFSMNVNPLDEAFHELRDGHTGNVGGDKRFQNLHTISTASSISPTTTNDSVTPHSFSQLYANGIERGFLKDRLHQYSKEFNIAKNSHIYVSKSLWARIYQYLPELSPENISKIKNTGDEMAMMEHRISFYLYGYWETFHRRFSIIHKPSFNTMTAEPLLLLSMLLIGCMYCATTPSEDTKTKASFEYKLCMLIAEPLRFRLFQHPGFKCPVEVWVLQSLNLLEWCEKNFLSRDMHERAHVHHGTTVQLLRRSPFLGGNPAVKNKPGVSVSEKSASGSEDEQSDEFVSNSEVTLSNDQSLFHEWVESESMKRITFMTFYLDTIDYIKFRHNPQIPFFQLQLLNLPCDETSLWESYEINGSFKKLVKRQKKLSNSVSQGARSIRNYNEIRPGMNFLRALKKLLRPQNTKQRYSYFTRSILLGGIVSIMHQMQQMELQSSFTLLSAGADKKRKSHWRELIVRSLDFHELNLHSAATESSSDPFFKVQDDQCKFPMYHLVSIMGISEINHYDIAIFGGSPRNMSVDVSSKDIDIIKRKLSAVWNVNGDINSFKDIVNLRSVIHCYWLLWSLMLKPLNENGVPNEAQRFHSLNADHDCFDVMYATSIASLVLWCYSFSTCGMESSINKVVDPGLGDGSEESFEKLSSSTKEDAHDYLSRIRDEFSCFFEQQGLSADYCIHKLGSNREQVSLFDAIQKHCEALPSINNKQNISGLCFYVGTKLYKSQWEIVRENAKLLINCGLRSTGKSQWFCNNLFENDLED